jgi:hypothetical protein
MASYDAASTIHQSLVFGGKKKEAAPAEKPAKAAAPWPPPEAKAKPPAAEIKAEQAAGAEHSST